MTAPVSPLEGVSVVVRGQFKATIFSPAWLLAQGLIGPAEMAAADIEVITRDVAVFSTGWLRAQVTPETLQLSTSELDEYDRVRDAASGVLRALSHTPIAAVGINHDAHVPMDTVAQWHAIGDAILPKQPWAEVLELPGMRSATVWGVRPDDYAGHTQVQVEPSLRVARAVFVSFNDLRVAARRQAPPVPARPRVRADTTGRDPGRRPHPRCAGDSRQRMEGVRRSSTRHLQGRHEARGPQCQTG